MYGLAGYPLMHFAHVEAFLLLALLPVALLRSLRPRHRGAARFSAVGSVASRKSAWVRWGPSLLTGLRAAAIVLLVIALAQPQTADARVHTHSNGISIQLVIDNSYCIRTTDYDRGSESISRLDAVKHSVRLFIAGGEHGLTGRPDDRIGIITFARDTDVVCPATLDHAADLKVKVYTIGAVGNRFTKTRVSRRGDDDSVDEPMMQKIAESTGGKYFRA